MYSQGKKLLADVEQDDPGTTFTLQDTEAEEQHQERTILHVPYSYALFAGPMRMSLLY